MAGAEGVGCRRSGRRRRLAAVYGLTVVGGLATGAVFIAGGGQDGTEQGLWFSGTMLVIALLALFAYAVPLRIRGPEPRLYLPWLWASFCSAAPFSLAIAAPLILADALGGLAWVAVTITAFVASLALAGPLEVIAFLRTRRGPAAGSPEAPPR